MTIRDLINSFPPKACRVVARKTNGRRGLTHREIADASGLAVTTVKVYSFRPNWDRIPLAHIEAFAAACGVNFLKLKVQKQFLTKRKWFHIQRATGPQKVFYTKLLTAKSGTK